MMKSVVFSITFVVLVVATCGGVFPGAGERELEPRFTAEKDVKLLLYTRANPTAAKSLVYGSSADLAASNFDISKPVKFVAHGWTHDGGSPINLELRDAFLAVLDVNFIAFDWGKGAAGLYPVAAANAPLAGAFLGKVVDWLLAEGVPVENVHIIGHSLGAHVVGIGGRSVTRGKVPYITGLDPAISLWTANSLRIRSTDAAYVEIIHTAGGFAGLTEPLGHNDFYPNGGSHQPGCELADITLLYFCSHARSWEYFGDSLDHTGYKAMQCANFDEMDKGKCSNISTLHMGGSKPKAPVGIFYLDTAKAKPYYLG